MKIKSNTNFTTNQHELTRTIKKCRRPCSCAAKAAFYSCGLWLILLIFPLSLFAQQSAETSRRDTIMYGTDTEITNLIQALKSENADYLYDELINLAKTSGNMRVLSGIFAFFGEREKSGLEDRAMKAVSERDNEANDTVSASLDYLGRMKYAAAVDVIIELLDTEERRFLSLGFRSLGRAGSADRSAGDKAAEFLIDFYSNRDPGADNRRELIIAIGTTGSTKGIEMLSEIAVNEDERIPLRTGALDALSKIGTADCVDAVLTCINTNDPNVRAAAVGALGPFSGKEVDNAILEAFRDSYYRTRIAAVQASRERKLVAAVPYLKYRAERDEVPNVREEAIRALGVIGNNEAVQILETLFTERKNSDRIRILSSEMVMKNASSENITRIIAEMEEAKRRNQTNLYSGFLRSLGLAVVTGDKTEMTNTAKRFLQAGNATEKLFALDMIANNNLTGINDDIEALAADRNEGIARKARRTLEILEEFKSGRRQVRTTEQRTVSSEQRTENKEQRTKSNEQRTESNEQEEVIE